MKHALPFVLIILALTVSLSPLKSQVCDLNKAIRNAEPMQVQACIDAKADLTARDANDRTPLLIAVTGDGGTVVPERQKKIVLALLTAGADVNAADAKGYTSLHYAAYQGTYDLVALLLEKGADPALKNLTEETPLLLAARGPLMDDGRLKTFELLLKAQADVRAADAEGRTALHLLCAHKPRLESPEAADLAILQIAQKLVAAGAAHDSQDLASNTPFANAMREGHAETALWLLDKGASAVPAALADFSALHLTVERGDVLLLDRLLRAGIDINQPTLTKRQAAGLAFFYPKGSTPVDLALISGHESKDPARQRDWKSLANVLAQRGGISKTYEEYVKGFKVLKGDSKPGSSKIAPRR